MATLQQITYRLARQKASVRWRLALRLVGAPWKEGGMSRLGCDCLGVVLFSFGLPADAGDRAAAARAGYPACARRPPAEAGAALVAFLTKYLVVCDVDGVPAPGDCLLFAFKRRLRPGEPAYADHVGVMADRGLVVHATRDAGVRAQPLAELKRKPSLILRP